MPAQAWTVTESASEFGVYSLPLHGSPVAVLEPDGRLMYLCLQPVGQIPARKLVVIDKLLLEADGAAYW